METYMSRHYKDWLKAYMDYTRESEPPESFYLWTGISTIGTCLRRQVWLNMGGVYEIYPNLYVVLVGPPGSKKNTSINSGIKLAQKVPDITEHISADATTREALIRALKLAEKGIMINATPYTHSSITIVSKELSVFLGTKNHDLLALLTDLFDCHDRWEYRTKNMGIDTITNEWLSILAGTTPTWLTGSVPLDAIGGGFTSRVIFVVEQGPKTRLAHPQFVTEMKQPLIDDLKEMSLMRGEFTMSPDCYRFFESWYGDLHLSKSSDPRFEGYYERKHIHVLKTSIIIATSLSDKMVIEREHFQRALEIVDATEGNMIDAFGSAGRSIMAQDIDDVLHYINQHGRLSRTALLRSIWRDISPRDTETVIQSLLDMKLIKREHDGTTNDYVYLSVEQKEKKI